MNIDWNEVWLKFLDVVIFIARVLMILGAIAIFLLLLIFILEILVLLAAGAEAVGILATLSGAEILSVHLFLWEYILLIWGAVKGPGTFAALGLLFAGAFRLFKKTQPDDIYLIPCDDEEPVTISVTHTERERDMWDNEPRETKRELLRIAQEEVDKKYNTEADRLLNLYECEQGCSMNLSADAPIYRRSRIKKSSNPLWATYEITITKEANNAKLTCN